MGWSSAGGIFDHVAQALIDAKATREIKIRALVPLIKGLQEGGWDTEDESMEIFQHDPDIMGAFRQAGIVWASEKELITYLYDNTHLSMDMASKVAETLHLVIQDYVKRWLEENHK